jgi:hypothetical protein
MSIVIEKLKDEPIVIHVVGESVSEDDIRSARRYDAELLSGYTGTVYRIVDARAWNSEFLDVIMIIAGIARGKQAHPEFENRVAEIVVTSEELVRMAAQSMSQEQYGGVNVACFEDVESALLYTREQIACSV